GITYTNTTGTFTGVTPGNYNVTYKNAGGCVSAQTPLTVNGSPGAPAAPTASVTVQPTCTVATGTIVVTLPTGAGLTYSIDGTNYQPGTTFTGVLPGNYNVTVQDAGGCISTATTLTVNTAPTIPGAPTTTQVDPTCAVATGTITITSATAGLTFSLDGAAYAAYPAGGYTGVAPGPHTISAQNAAGCISPDANVTIATAPAAPAAPTTAQVDPTCAVDIGRVS